MKTTAAILILIVNLWNLTSNSPLHGLFDKAKTNTGGGGGAVTMLQDPPDDGNNIIIPPPR